MAYQRNRLGKCSQMHKEAKMLKIWHLENNLTHTAGMLDDRLEALLNGDYVNENRKC